MEFDDRRVDASGVDDLRGHSPGAPAGPLGGGGGGGALGGALTAGLVAKFGLPGLLVALLLTYGLAQLGGGGDPAAVSPLDASAVGAGGGASVDLQQRCNTGDAIDRYTDCYIVKVFNETNEVWTAYARQNGIRDFRTPRLVFFTGRVSTGCGPATSDVGPFYCPPDERIYLDLDFLAALQQRLGAQGRYAQAYILAHEYGHHLQTVLGTEQQVRRLQQQQPGRANTLSVRMELQADCYAGVWGRLANDAGNLTVTSAEIAEAQRAAAAVGDDRIQAGAGRRVNPETWTHGSAQQRQQWYNRGYAQGDIRSCNTFGS